MAKNRYRLQNRYQDSGWEWLEEAYSTNDLGAAIRTADKLSEDAIIYGMVRVVDIITQEVMATYAAGGGRADESPKKHEVDHVCEFADRLTQIEKRLERIESKVMWL